jgi:hypothetical protein
MPPKPQQKARHNDIYYARFDRIANMKHALVVLASKVDWAWLDDELAGYFCDQAVRRNRCAS